MLDLIGSSLIGLLLELFGRSPAKLEPLQLVSWQNAVIFTLPSVQNDPAVENIIQQYLHNLSDRGINPKQQGIWIQSDWLKLTDYQGTVPRSAASLTKIPTTLAALAKWGVEHQFETKIYRTGKIEAGVLQGDLIIEGSGDPLFVWEEAIAVGNALEQLGISRVEGNLIVTKQFYMNYQSDPQLAAELLHQGLNHRLWTPEAQQQYLTLPTGTAKPQIAITQKIQVAQTVPPSAELLLNHRSLTLGEILKQMNIYSNNKMAQMLADLLGGADDVASFTAQAVDVPPTEIQLINGSGLGEENRLSPRAVCRMLSKIDSLLLSHSLQVADLFPTAGRDRVGTMENRTIPLGVAIKTGTLNRVSALAGVIPLGNSSHDKIWFAIINNGSEIEYYRQQQDRLLQHLVEHWQIQPIVHLHNSPSSFLGDPNRNFQAEL